MLVSRIALSFAILTLACGPLAPQTPADPLPAPAQVAVPQAAAPRAVSPMLQPALDTLHTAMQGLRLDKWKGGSVRAEAERNISSIMSDLETTLPPMLKTADADPARVSALLPVARNLDALYDVVLRVFDGARVAGPGDQAAAIQQAMSGLETARRTFNDHLQEAAVAQEKQMGDLRVTLRAQAAPVCPVTPAPSCPAPAKPAVKRKPKPAAKTAPAKTAPGKTNAPAAQPGAATPAKPSS